MTKKETFEAAVANHVRKQIAAGAKELGGCIKSLTTAS